jgi:hypothetical protein
MKTLKLFLILLIASCLYSCESGEFQSNRSVCNCKEREKVKEFVASSIKNANNMSDEEMEDVIYQLQKTGVQINCHQKIFFFERGSYSINWENPKNKLDTGEVVYDY